MHLLIRATSALQQSETLDKGSYRSTAEELLFNKDLPYDGTYNSSQFRITADSPDDAIPQTVIGQGDTEDHAASQCDDHVRDCKRRRPDEAVHDRLD